MNLKKNIRYFRGVSAAGQVWMIVIGGIHFLAGYIAGDIGFIMAAIGAILVAAGVGLLIHRKRSVISDEKYDTAVFNSKGDLVALSMVRTGVNESEIISGKPIVMSGYNFVKANYVKQGRDNRWRSDIFDSLVILPTDKALHCYRHYFCTTMQKTEEVTEVYYYNNIVDTSIVTQTGKVKNRNITYESFVLTATGGATINVCIFDTNCAYEAVNTIRKIINDKKA